MRRDWSTLSASAGCVVSFWLRTGADEDTEDGRATTVRVALGDDHHDVRRHDAPRGDARCRERRGSPCCTCSPHGSRRRRRRANLRATACRRAGRPRAARPRHRPPPRARRRPPSCDGGHSVRRASRRCRCRSARRRPSERRGHHRRSRPADRMRRQRSAGGARRARRGPRPRPLATHLERCTAPRGRVARQRLRLPRLPGRARALSAPSPRVLGQRRPQRPSQQCIRLSLPPLARPSTPTGRSPATHSARSRSAEPDRRLPGGW